MAVIAWTSQEPPGEMAARYELQRAFDSQELTTIYTGADTSYQDFIPTGVQSVTYSIRSYAVFGFTWQDIKNTGNTWQDWNNLEYSWGFDISEPTDGTFEVIPNRAPVINGQDSDLGYKYLGFTYEVIVTDPDPGNTVSFRIALDGKQIHYEPNAQLGVPYFFEITDEFIFSQPDLSEHTILIFAQDSKGLSSTRTYRFTTAEDVTLTAVYYVIRDNIPVARIESGLQWTDYLAVGTHRYKIRGVDKYDNFVDSNEVEITIIVNGSTLALASNPEDFVVLHLRRDDRPQRSGSLTPEFSEVQYEGRKFPVYKKRSQRKRAEEVEVTTYTKAQYDKLYQIIDAGDIVCYRDCYDKITFGVVTPFSYSFISKTTNHIFSYVVDVSLSISQSDYNEAVQYV